MKWIPENIRQSQFAKNVSVLATGTIIVQAISTLLSPILSRLYTPEDYGLLAILTSFISILTVIGSFRFELAIILPEKNSEAALILKLSLLITIIISVLVFIITLIFNNTITSMFGNEKLSFWIYFIAPVFLAAGTSQAFTYWFNRNKKYKIISGVRIYQSSVNSGLSVLLGFLKFNTTGLIISLIVSNMVSVFYLLKRSAFKLTKCSLNFFNLRSVAKKYREFPLLSLPSALLDTVSVNSIIFLLSYFFSESITGAYSFSIRMLSIPAIVIGTAMGQVFFQKISEAYTKNEKVFPLIIRMWKLLFLTGVVPTIIIFFFGEELFTFIFGSKWIDAGKISEYLCILTFFMFISSPTSNAMIVLRKQKLLLGVNIAAFIYRPMALIYGYSINNFLAGIILLIICEVIQIIIFNIILIRSAAAADSGKGSTL